MKKNFLNSVEMLIPQGNSFDLSNSWQNSGRIGNLIPCMWKETYPGETIRFENRGQVKFAPLVVPTYSRFMYKTEHFGIPKAALWKNYEKWISNEKDEFDNLPAFPTVTIKADGSNYTPLMSALGIPDPTLLDIEADMVLSAMPFAAYQACNQFWYKDENLQDDIVWELEDGDNSLNLELFEMRRRSLLPDLATKALPFAQKGNPVSLPLGKVSLDVSALPQPGFFKDADDQTTPMTGAVTGGISGVLNVAGNQSVYDPNGTLKVDATTINDLRTAEAIQQFEEMQARGGSKYYETSENHFGKTIPDYRLRQPELLGGSVTPIVISEVTQTSGTTDESPQGNMSGKATGYNVNDHCQWNSPEWCIVMTIMSIMPPTAYSQGIEKAWFKHQSPFQELWPVLANLGEEKMETNEVYAFQNSNTFGYLPRYYNDRMGTNIVGGEFAKPSLRAWTAARQFTAVPVLNEAFILADPGDYDYLFADTTTNLDKLYFNIWNNFWVHNRKLGKYGQPKLQPQI